MVRGAGAIDAPAPAGLKPTPYIRVLLAGLKPTPYIRVLLAEPKPTPYS